MPSEFRVKVPFRETRGEDYVLDESDDSAKGHEHYITDPAAANTSVTRKIVRPKYIPDNPKDSSARVKATLLHQKRAPNSAKASEDWEDATPFNLVKLPKEQEVRLELSAGETKRLTQALLEFYREAGTLPQLLTDSGIKVVDRSEHLILQGEERKIIERLVNSQGDQFWEHIDALGPNILQARVLKKQQIRRERAVRNFEEHLQQEDWDEPHWQRFFEHNRWIFGHNLLFQFLSILDDQAHVGGTMYDGRGAQRTDTLAATEAQLRFTVVIDIKRPDAELVLPHSYRNHAFSPGEDLIGGVAQLQSYCRRWELEGSQQENNRERLRSTNTYTYQPKGILVIGNLSKLESLDEKASFELFRRNLYNPEILTFDELLERARYTVQIEEEFIDTSFDEVPF